LSSPAAEANAEIARSSSETTFENRVLGTHDINAPSHLAEWRIDGQDKV